MSKQFLSSSLAFGVIQPAPLLPNLLWIFTEEATLTTTYQSLDRNVAKNYLQLFVIKKGKSIKTVKKKKKSPINEISCSQARAVFNLALHLFLGF